MCMAILPACMFVSCAFLVPTEAKRAIKFSGTGVIATCERPCRFQESNCSPLEEEPVLFTAEPSFYDQETVFYMD